MIIDEVQMVPELFRALIVVVDETWLKDKSHANGRYLLTGSANILALPKLSDLLVGRMTVLTLYPFSTAEATQGKGNGLDRLIDFDFTGINNRGLSIIDAIRLATFPEIADKNTKERSIRFDGYLTTILQRDVKLIAELEKISVHPTGLQRYSRTRRTHIKGIYRRGCSLPGKRGCPFWEKSLGGLILYTLAIKSQQVETRCGANRTII